MPGANYVLSKGFLASGSTAYAFGEAVILAAGTTLQPAQVARASVAGDPVIGICQENLDATKVTTGKAYVGVQILGIAKCIAGGAVALGAKVMANASARAVTATATNTPFGIALSTAAADGDIFDVLLTPGMADLV